MFSNPKDDSSSSAPSFASRHQSPPKQLHEPYEAQDTESGMVVPSPKHLSAYQCLIPWTGNRVGLYGKSPKISRSWDDHCGKRSLDSVVENLSGNYSPSWSTTTYLHALISTQSGSRSTIQFSQCKYPTPSLCSKAARKHSHVTSCSSTLLLLLLLLLSLSLQVPQGRNSYPNRQHTMGESCVTMDCSERTANKLPLKLVRSPAPTCFTK